MPTATMLTRLSPEALARPQSVVELNRQIEERLTRKCPGGTWLANDAVLGPCDYLNIVEAPAVAPATKVSLLGRSVGQVTTETWVVTPWERFLDLGTGLQSAPSTHDRVREEISP